MKNSMVPRCILDPLGVSGLIDHCYCAKNALTLSQL